VKKLSTVGTAAALGLLAPNCAVLAQGAGQAGGPPASAQRAAVVVPLAGRMEVFELDRLDGAEAPATRMDARASMVRRNRIALLDGARPAQLGGGWSLTDRVLFRGADPASARAVVAAAGGRADSVRALPGLSGWFAAEAGRIDAAADLARRLVGALGAGSAELDVWRPVVQRGGPNDPLFQSQWHLQNAFIPGADINVVPVWDMGYTGRGVVIGIVESFGFQTTHPDLAPNYDAARSQPGVFFSGHMTAVAGLAAGVGDNGLGITGVAYDATLTQALIGSDEAVATALLLHNDFNDIKNNSWGPLDNGRLDPMPAVVNAALIESVATGRGGLGEIIVWAGGNGRGSNDRVDYDPFAASRYTIAVAAVGDDDVVAPYSEPGSSLLISAYSDGGSLGITSTTTNNGYTFNFGGTSAASPIAAGVVALMLDANPSLTWRDVQHILVDTARPVTVADETWGQNGAGRLVSENYGYGMIDALAAVTAAQAWANVEPEVTSTTGVVSVNEPLPDNVIAGVTRTATIDDPVRIESVELILNADAEAVGDLDIDLTSPDGTVSTLSRNRFDSQDDLVGTVFTSARHWGERSDGTWTVRIADARPGNASVWTDFEIRVHGASLGNPPCGPADLALPLGTLDLADTVAFVTAYLTQDSDADFAEPFGVWNQADISAFIVAFGGGCP
jgi:subtilisin-like proprotein convertase family protein